MFSGTGGDNRIAAIVIIGTYGSGDLEVGGIGDIRDGVGSGGGVITDENSFTGKKVVGVIGRTTT